jgi:hypothetical protein
MPAQARTRSHDRRVEALEREVSILSADLNSVKTSKLPTCPADIPVCSSANKCTKCPLQCGGFCQSLSSHDCDLNSCVTCPVGMKLVATSDMSTGNCVPCLHEWYDSSTGKIIDTACNGGSYLSSAGTFALASRCTLDSFGKAACSATPPGAAAPRAPLAARAPPHRAVHADPATQRLQWAQAALRKVQAEKARIVASSRAAAALKPVAARKRPITILADAGAANGVSTSATNTDVDAVRTHTSYRHSTSEGSPWFRTLHNGDRASSLTTVEQVLPPHPRP